MKRMFAVMIVLTLVGLIQAQNLTRAVPSAPVQPAVVAMPAQPAGAVGRYQLIGVSNGTSDDAWMIDTQTGDTWRRQGGRWVYAGNPTVDPGIKAPATRPAAPVLPERP